MAKIDSHDDTTAKTPADQSVPEQTVSSERENFDVSRHDLANLLSSTGLATICLDHHLRVQWFTSAATEFFSLAVSDVGRPLEHLAHRFSSDDLIHDARQVLDQATPLIKDVETTDGETYLRRVTPYRTADDRIVGVVIMLVDISDRKQMEGELRLAKEFAEKIIDTVREPLLVLDPDLRVVSASQSFYETFQVEVSETEEHLIYELGNGQWDIPRLRELLDDVLPRNNGFHDFVVDHDFEQIGHRTMKLNARRIDHVNFTLLSIEDITLRLRSELQLAEFTRTLEQEVSRRIQTQQILHDVTLAANEATNIKEAFQTALRCICRYNHWQVGHVWRRDESGEAMVSADIWYIDETASGSQIQNERLRSVSAEASLAWGEGLIGQVVASRRIHWIDDLRDCEHWRRGDADRLGVRAAMAFPVIVNGEVSAVLECFASQSMEREDRFIEIMEEVGIQLGHLIERKRLERAVADTAAAQQRYFAQELHDSISQELTGVTMMAGTLLKQLEEQMPDHAKLLANLINHLREVQRQIRRLSRGLRPVEVDPQGLSHALREVADVCEQIHGIKCVAECSSKVNMEHAETATEMYRIAQEALQNAIKHAQASELRIKLDSDEHETILTIQDNGQGLPETISRSNGSGQQIMRYRANLIGATLHVDSEPGRGVTVTCRLPHNTRRGRRMDKEFSPFELRSASSPVAHQSRPDPDDSD